MHGMRRAIPCTSRSRLPDRLTRRQGLRRVRRQHGAHDVRCRQDRSGCPVGQAAGGRIDWYLIAGPTPRERVATLHRTHRPHAAAAEVGARLPAIALHVHARIARARSRRRRCASKRIPADAIWLDIDFQDGEQAVHRRPQGVPGFRRDDRRPAQGRLAHGADHRPAYREATGGYAPYDSGKAMDAFVKRGGADYVGKVWPGDSVFPDFTLRARARLVGRAVHAISCAWARRGSGTT